MNPFAKAVVILLVGAAIGAVVAGGALKYAGGASNGPVPLRSYDPAPDREIASAPFAEASPRESSSSAPASDLSKVRRKPLLSTDGPTAAVTADGSEPVVPEMSKPPVKKKALAVVEEESADPKVKEEEIEGGSLRDQSPKSDDGGSVR